MRDHQSITPPRQEAEGAGDPGDLSCSLGSVCFVALSYHKYHLRKSTPPHASQKKKDISIMAQLLRLLAFAKRCEQSVLPKISPSRIKACTFNVLFMFER